MERADFDQWKAREVARLLALVESERRYYQELVATLPVPLAIVSLDGFVVSANRAFRQLFLARGEDLQRLSIDKLLPVAELPAKIQEAHAQATPIAPFTVPCVLAGSERTLRIAVSAVRNWSDENALETVLILEDLGDAIPPTPPATVPADLPAVVWQGVWQADTATLRFQSVHGAAEALTGFPPEHWTGHAEFFEQRIYDEDRARVLALYRTAIETGSEASAEFRAVSTSGALVWLRETVRATGTTLTGVLTDISRRKELERQLLASSRIDALHRLAGRLAHDLNNPLMIVQGYTEEMFESLAADDSRRYDTNEILKAAERMRTLTSQLIDFAHPQARPAESVDLGVVLAALETRLAQAVGAGVTLELTPPGYSLWASAERIQLEDLVVAWAGMRAGAPDLTRLTVSWHADTLTESVAGSTLPPGRYACITLHDNGQSLDEPRRAGLFEAVLPSGPRTDTLARAYAAVREWGGDIAAESGPTAGNTLAICLPFVAAPAQAPASSPAAEAPAPVPEPMRETILVVDDEPGIRGLIRKILRREHYNVLEAGNGEDALTVALSHAGSIHLLLTDVIMPGLSGPELARRMCEASPELKVLLISGYSGEDPTLTEKLPSGYAFLPKPFTLGALVSTVRETLDS